METIMPPTERKASKDHRCDFCGERIAAGDTYTISTHKHDGDIYDWKTHKYCSNLADKMNMYQDADEGVNQDSFMEHVSTKYYDLMIGLFPDREISKPSIILGQLRWVSFKQKLRFVIAHFATLEKMEKEKA